MSNQKWLVRILVSVLLTLSYLPCQAEMIQAGAKIINGGDRGIPYKPDCSGDVCVSYEGEDGFATVATSNLVELEVAQVNRLRIEPIFGSINGRSGQTVCRDFTIVNIGNGTSTITCQVVGLKWETDVSEDFFILAPGQKKRVLLKIKIPTDKNIIGKSSTVTLVVTSSGKDSQGEVDKVSAKTTITVVSRPCSCCLF